MHALHIGLSQPFEILDFRMSAIYRCPTCATYWHSKAEEPACPICEPEKFPTEQRREIEENNRDLFAEVRFRLAQPRLPFEG